MILCVHTLLFRFFFFNDTATTEIYTLSLHDALPIWNQFVTMMPRRTRFSRRIEAEKAAFSQVVPEPHSSRMADEGTPRRIRSEEHTSELQSRQYLVCRLLLEKKKKTLISTL